MPALKASLAQAQLGGDDPAAAVDQVLSQHCATVDASKSALAELQPFIDDCFAPALRYQQRRLHLSEALQEIAARLQTTRSGAAKDSSAHQFADQALDSISKQCPFSMGATLRHFSEVACAVAKAPSSMQIEDVMQVSAALRFPCR